ncbi:hypothetical protein [Denitrobaculum tricleocarpae]|uniref:PEP-CTERM sorting domain-containing protein n=1 Tax=Denitrobaculum tricleocarpae TaxID=2591009 RepID=A0A545T7U9_9PROT|nr:hypothetical protein [Denitrobaculum tricleocarpae]TQV73272.1 hypothetical protein FKG95_24955 [Denitrobaculum tricleocarpae]
MATRLFAWVLAVLGLYAPVTAQAASFAISNIVFSNEAGNDQGFKWSVEWAPDSRFDLETGEEAVVIYGALIIHDLRLPPALAHDSGAHDSGAQYSDAQYSGGSFQVSFDISPADGTVSMQGSPVARFLPNPLSVSVDFDNTPRAFSFGEGGVFLLTFLDSTRVENSGLFLLSAKIELISDSRPSNPAKDKAPEAQVTNIPEPAKHARLESTPIGTDAARFHSRTLPF